MTEDATSFGGLASMHRSTFRIPSMAVRSLKLLGGGGGSPRFRTPEG